MSGIKLSAKKSCQIFRKYSRIHTYHWRMTSKARTPPLGIMLGIMGGQYNKESHTPQRQELGKVKSQQGAGIITAAAYAMPHTQVQVSGRRWQKRRKRARQCSAVQHPPLSVCRPPAVRCHAVSAHVRPHPVLHKLACRCCCLPARP